MTRLRVASGDPGERWRPGDRLPFALVFRGPTTPLLPQATYAMEHRDWGRFEIFLVPIGKDERGVRYQAIFS